MNVFVVAITLLCATSAFAADESLASTEVACREGAYATEDHDIVVDRKPYDKSINHVRFVVTVKIGEATASSTLTVCFDTPQCITGTMGFLTYAVEGQGQYCFNFVHPKERDLMRKAGDKMMYEFQTYGPTAPAQISTITLHGNGVVEGERAVAIPPSKGEDFCTFCDGAHFGDLSDCTKFYRCFSKHSVAMSCPFGTVYDESLKVCNYLQEAGCYATQKMGVRRYQCRDGDNNCPTLASDMRVYDQTYHVSACSHNDAAEPQPTVAPPAEVTTPAVDPSPRA